VTRAKDQARSITAKLSQLSKDLGVAYPKIFTEFILERLAYRLISHSDLRGKLVFKGGYVSLRVYESPRYTIDLDALLRRGRLDSIASVVRLAAEEEGTDGVWFRLEKTVDLQTQGEYGGLRIVMRAGLGEIPKNLKKAQIVHLDIGKGDPVVPGPVEVETPFILGGGSLSWRVYPVETTVAEKLHALVVRGSERWPMTFWRPLFCKRQTGPSTEERTFSRVRGGYSSSFSSSFQTGFFVYPV
jgi:hypothetical protein